MRKFLHIISLLLINELNLPAQNLVPNFDFEYYASCPMGFGGFMYMFCEPWHCAGTGTSDYFNVCCTTNEVDIPTNYFGFQNAHSGNAYAGFFLRGILDIEYREYLQTPLLSPLIAGHGYYVSFYVSLADNYCGIQEIGAYFSIGPPPFSFYLPLEVTPQIETHGVYLDDKTEWMKIEACFIASGGENTITIGNFHSNAETPLDPFCITNLDRAYYYIDDVSVVEVPVDILDFDLGPPVTACYSYTIDATIPSDEYVEYFWEDGSTGPTLTVDVSGTYTVTVNDGCRTGVDSIDVTIIDSSPIEINPDELTLCQGETFSFNLDPDQGDYVWSDGSTSPNYTISTSGVYGITLNDGCDLTEDEITVTVVDPPEPISIGDEALLCQGDEIELSLDPGLGDFLWQDNSTSADYVISHGGTYAVTVSNICGEESATLVVEEEFPVQVDLGAGTTYLCNGDTLDISFDALLGSYTWQDGSVGSSYHITNPGWYYVTLTQVCTQSSDSMQVLTSSAPVFSLGDTLTICPGGTILLSTNGVNGNYTWQDGSTNDSLQVSLPGIYALTISNACGVHSDSVVVLGVDTLSPPDLGTDFSLCTGEEFILSAGNQNANYVWQDLSTADTLLISGAGVYSVQVSNACYSYSDTVVVSINNNAPQIVLPDQISLCEGSIVILDPSVTGVTYQWSDGSQNPTLSVTDPGEYSLTVSSLCGIDIDTIQILNGGLVPSVSLGIDTSICEGQSIILNPSFSNADHWLWTDGSTSSNYMVSDSGLINVAVSNACGVAYDTIDVGLSLAPPDLDLGIDTSLCSGESLTLSILIPAIDIQWSDGSANDDLVINSPGTYFASISNQCGISNDTIVINALPDIPALNLGADLPLCPGESLTITPGIPNVDYLWQDGSTDTFFIADHNQTVSLIISNACGTSTDALDIFTSTDGPDVELGPDVLACEGEVVTINSNISGVNYIWQDGSTNSSFTTTTSGIYSLQVSNACGTDIDSIVVDIHGTVPDPALGPDTILCEGNSLTLTSNADIETTTSWQNGSALSNFQVNAPGTYILTQTNHCGEKQDSIHVSYQSLPVDVDLGPDTVLCPGETLLLSAPATSDQLAWQDGSSSSTFLADQAGHYTLSVSNECGTKTDELALTYDDRLPQFAFGDSTALCPGKSILLDATQPFDADYEWSTGSTSSSITINTPGDYAVTVRTACNEAMGGTILYLDIGCASPNDIYIPNVFSPNDDNINDVFSIYFHEDIEVISIEGSIFDRWGDLVFSSSENPFIWDGKFSGQDVMPGVYVYSFIVNYKINGEEIREHFTGDVTVIR